MNVEQNLKQEIMVVENVYRATQVVIDGMPSGVNARMEIQQMTEAVGAAVNMSPKDILHMVNRYAHNNLDGYVRRGKKGGYIKGIRPLKIEKTADVQSIDALVDADSI